MPFASSRDIKLRRRGVSGNPRGKLSNAKLAALRKELVASWLSVHGGADSLTPAALSALDAAAIYATSAPPGLRILLPPLIMSCGSWG
jgi:hypothetical protein